MADPIVEELQLDISSALDSLGPLGTALGELGSGFAAAIAESLGDALSSAFDKVPASLPVEIEQPPPLVIEGDTSTLQAEVDAALLPPAPIIVEGDTSDLTDAIAAISTPVTVSVDADTGPLVAQVAEATGDIPPTVVPVDADTGPLVAAIDEAVSTPIPPVDVAIDVSADAAAAQAEIDAVHGDTVDIAAVADVTDAQNAIDAATAPRTVPVDADIDAAISAIGELALQAAVTVPVDGDTVRLENAIADAFDAPRPLIPVDADTNPLEASISDAVAAAQPTVPVDGDTTALVDAIAGAFAEDVPSLIVEGDVSALDAAIADALDVPRSVPVDGDTGALAAAIDDTVAAAQPVVLVAADTTAAQEAINALAAEPIEVPVGADTSGAQESISSLSSSSSEAAGSLESLTGGVEALKGASGLAQGDVGALGGIVANINPEAATATAGLAIFTAFIGESVSLAADAEAQNKRFAATFGVLADSVRQINVGGLTISLKQLGEQSGTTSVDLEATASRLGQLGKSAGAPGPQIVDTTTKLLALGATIAVNNPRLGDAADVSDKLANAFLRGGKALVPFSISLSKAQIEQEALKETGKATAAELTIYERIVAGANLATGQFGDTLGSKFKDGSENAQVQLRALKVRIEETLTAVGGPLLQPLVDSLTAVLPVAVQLGEAIGALGRVVLPFAAALGPALAAVALPLGLVTDGLNFIADILGHVPGPALAVAGVLGALAIAAHLSAFGFKAVAISLEEMTVALATNPFTIALVAIGALGLALDVFGGHTDQAKANTKTFTDALFGAGAGADDLGGQLAKLEDNLDGVLQKFIELQPVGSDFREALDGAGGGVDGLRTALLGSQKDFDTYSDTVGRAANAGTGLGKIWSGVLQAGLADQRKALQDAEQAQLAALVSTNKLTQAQLDQIESQHHLADGSVDLVASLKAAEDAAAKAAEAARKHALSESVASGSILDAAAAYAAGGESVAEFETKLKSLGLEESDAKTFATDMAAAQTKAADALLLTSPAVESLIAQFGAGAITASQFEAAVVSVGVSVPATKAELDAVGAAVDAFVKKAGEALPTLETALSAARDSLKGTVSAEKSALDAQVTATGAARDNVDAAYAALAAAHEVGGAKGAEAVASAQSLLQAALVAGGAKIGAATLLAADASNQLAAATDPQRVIENLQKQLTQITDFEAHIQAIVAAGGTALAAKFVEQGPVLAGAQAAAFATDPTGTKIAEGLIGQTDSAKTKWVAWVKLHLGADAAAAVEAANGPVSAAFHPDWVPPTAKAVADATATIKSHQAALFAASLATGTGGSDKYKEGFKPSGPTTAEVTKARQIIEAAKNPHGAAAKALGADATGKYGGALALPGETGKNLANAAGVFSGPAGQVVATRAHAQGGIIGNAFGQGMASGISSQTFAVQAAASAAAQAAIDAANRKLPHKSPSPVGIEIGAAFGQGLAVGIADASPVVERATSDLADLVTSSLSDARVTEIALDINIAPVPLTLTPTVDPVVPQVAPIRLEPDLAPIPPVSVETHVQPIVDAIPRLSAGLDLHPTIDALRPLAAALTVTPVVDPIPPLETDAVVHPTVDPLPRLDAGVQVHPTVDALPSLTTSAVVHPRVEALPILTTTVAVSPLIAPLPRLATIADVRLNVGALPNLSLDAAVRPVVPSLAAVGLVAEVAPVIPALSPVDLDANVRPNIPDLPAVPLDATVDPILPRLAPLALTGRITAAVAPIPPLTIDATVAPVVPDLAAVPLDATVDPTVPDLAPVSLRANVEPTVPRLPAATLNAAVRPIVPRLETVRLDAALHLPPLRPVELDTHVRIPALVPLDLDAFVKPHVPRLAALALDANVEPIVPALRPVPLDAIVDPLVPNLRAVPLEARVEPFVPALADTTLIAHVHATMPAIPAQNVNAFVRPILQPQAATFAAVLSSFVTGQTRQLDLAGRGAGAAITSGITASLRSSRPVAEAATSIGTSIEAALKRRLQISSPSAVGIKIGNDFSDGIAAGLTSDIGGIERAGRTLANAATDAVMIGFNDPATVSAAQARLDALIDADNRAAAAAKALADAGQSAEQKAQAALQAFQSFLSGAVGRVPEADSAISTFSSNFSAAMAKATEASRLAHIAWLKYQHDLRTGANTRTIFIDADEWKKAQHTFELTQKALASMSDPTKFIASLQKQTASLKAFQADLSKIAAVGNDDLAEQLATAGPEVAGALAHALALSPAKAKLAEFAIENGQAYSDAFSKFLETQFKSDFTNAAADAGTTAGQTIAVQVANALDDDKSVAAAATGLMHKIKGALPADAISIPVSLTPAGGAAAGGAFANTAPLVIGAPTSASTGPTQIQLDLVVHLEDGTVVTAEPTTIVVQSSKLLQRVKAEVSAQ